MRDTANALAAAGAFSEIEEDFFRRGDAMETWDDDVMEDVPVPPKRLRAITSSDASEDDWEWQIAIARARAAAAV
jgi:hypothetical protein